MRTTRLETNCMYFSFSGHHQMYDKGGPQMNKFEQVSSDDHHMLVVKG